MLKPALAHFSALCLSLLMGSTWAAPTAELSSPDGRLRLQLELDYNGHPLYSVQRRGQAVIAPSRLGFLLTDAPKLDGGFVLSASSSRSFDERWEQPWGEQRFIRNRYNELRATLTENHGQKRSLELVLRAYDDGVALRYQFPDQPALKNISIGEELTEFNVASAGTAWWNTAFEWNREEYLYKRTPINEVGLAQTPMTLRTDTGLHLSVHEAALIDYAGMNLARVEDRRFKAMLTPGSGGQPKVVRAAPFATPWRMITITETAAQLAESRLMLNLNEPNQLGDVSWFKPMKYVGIWWEMHQNLSTWGSGDKHGATTANALKHIDFAAKHGFGGVLVEGWNQGWDGDWVANGDKFSFTQPYPDFDLERITAYAKSKGVQLIGHHETSANAANYESQLPAALDLYARLGVGAVKTGYVSDAAQARVPGADGVVRFGWHEGQDMVRHHMKVVQEAAKRRIAINPHEPVKDTGLRRTYPNWISREGARGQEYNAWGNPGNPPEHETNLVFTRLLSSPMDFTPGIFGMKTQQPAGVATTWAKQLALYVVIYSPIQMAADLLANYEANPKPFQFIKDVPTDWSETRVLNGEVGDYVTIARKDRNSEDWFLGAITDEHARNLNIKLDFLTPGQRYRAHIYRDGAKANYTTHREDIVIEQREVKPGTSLQLRLAPGGGQAIRFEKLAAQ